MDLLVILAIILIVLAIGGGVFVAKFLWLFLIIALILFAIRAVAGRGNNL